MSPISVLIVDDHPIVAQGMAAMLAAQPDLEVVGTCATRAEGVRRAAELRPDVVLLDARLPDGHGPAAIGAIAAGSPATRVIIVSAEPEASVLRPALAAGGRGVVSKARPHGELAEAIRIVVAGGIYLGPGALAGAMGGPNPAGRDRLTPREVEVLQLLAGDLSTAELAARLGLSANTVSNHIQNALTKLGAHTRLGAILAAHRLGVITVPDRAAPG